MSIKNKERNYSCLDQDLIDRIRALLDAADQVVVGGGAGLSAAGGLDYGDPSFFKDHYPAFYQHKYRTLNDAIAGHWHLTEKTKKTYWGFWIHHIQTVYYQMKQLGVYKDLFDLIGDKAYFVITTNADQQFYKGLFDPKRVYSMQGAYNMFQCQTKCHLDLYDNQAYIEAMFESLNPQTFEVAEEAVPRCPRCGGLLSPNLRIDHYHVSDHTEGQREAYIDFINQSTSRTLFLELGVGYNTPILIRYPFEEIVNYFGGALVRINLDYIQATKGVTDQSVLVKEDIRQVLKAVKQE